MEKENWMLLVEEGEASVRELDRPQVPIVPSIDDDFQSYHRQQPPCIYTVPAWLKDPHPGAFEPRVVSLGPYHYGNPKLKPMEKHKQRAFRTFLRRAKAKEPLAAIKKAMKAVVEQLKSSYEGLEDLSCYLDTKETKEQNPQLSLEERFLQLMIVDGCFILEVLRAWQAYPCQPTGYEDTDPVFSVHGIQYMLRHVRRDMLMLENQLPMLALTTIADAAQTGLQKRQLIEQIRMFRSVNWFVMPIIWTSWEDTLHTLDDIIKCATQFGDYIPSNPPMRWSATELHEGGVKFRKSRTSCVKDISFDTSKGILSLPPIQVSEDTESVLLNMMAFEHLHVGAGNAVTAYVRLMDTLIDSARDVELLRTNGIVTEPVGSDENIAKIFNRISYETVVIFQNNPNSVDNLLSNYRNNKLNRWRASFVHTYLRNPWVFFSLLGAFILLFLTVLQDVYTVLTYYSN